MSDHDLERDTTSHGSHGPEPAAQLRQPLSRGAGTGKLLFFDCFSGSAGDMCVAALLDLGVPLPAIESALAQLPLEGYRLQVSQTQQSGIGATRFDVLVENAQPERSYAQIDEMLQSAPLDDKTASLARAMFRLLGLAEAKAHRVPLSKVHFHEVGAVDSIVDIVGAAAALSFLGAEEIVFSPLPLGRGFVKARHGVLPIPAPATVFCLRDAPTFDGGVESELVTPTGATIAASCAHRFCRWPSFAPEQVGFGAGHRKLPGRPNLLRVVLGKPTAETQLDGAADTHCVVEANVDDMTGELAAHAIEALLAAGALDAWAAPTIMKKGRPGLTIAALTRTQQSSDVAQVMLRETTSIGLRQLAVSRTERPRRMLQVQTRFGELPIKLSEGSFGPALAKPEFDACAQAARKHNVPVREVIEEALTAFRHRSR